MTGNRLCRVFQNMIHCRNKGISHTDRGHERFLEKHILNYVKKPVRGRSGFVIKTFYNENFKYFDSTRSFLDDVEYFKANIKIKPEILKAVQDFSKKFNDNTISIHIRTWRSTTNSITNDDCAHRRGQTKDVVLEKIYSLMKNHINTNPNVNFFIAVDDFKYKKIISERFNNVLFYEPISGLSNIQNDFVDLLLLGKTKEILGIHGSTFTMWAWRLRDIHVSKKITVLNFSTGDISYTGEFKGV